MENEETAVNEDQVAEGQEALNANEGVTSNAVDRDVYEKVRDAMKSEREAKKAAEAKAAELEERLARLENRPETYREDYTPQDAKVDILFMMNKDPFIRENLDLIEHKMTDNPEMDVKAAVREVKAEFFDRIQKEVSVAESNQPLKQERTTAIQEEVSPQRSGDDLKDTLEGKFDNVPPEMRAAMKRVLNR